VDGKVNKNLIAICGHAGSGKDSLAASLIPYGYENIKFSQPVKDFVTELLGREIDKKTDRNLIIDVSWYMKGHKVADLMKKYEHLDLYRKANDWVNRLETPKNLFFTDFFWADLTLRQLKEGGKYVFTDIRLPSERDRVMVMGGVFVRVNVPRPICEERLNQRDGGFSAQIWETAFEKSFLEWDYHFELDGTKTPQEVQQDLFKGLGNICQ
jgi:hypothetical protein